MAGRLADRLASRFGVERVFMDVDSIEPGIDFADAIDAEVSRCDVMVVLIGTAWSPQHHRTDQLPPLNREDFVALEVSAALARGIRVIPVLVEGARLPLQEELPEALQPLLRRHAVRLDHDSFRAQVGPLIESVSTALDAAVAARAEGAETSPGAPGSKGRTDPSGLHPSSPSEADRRLSRGQDLVAPREAAHTVAGQTHEPVTGSRTVKEPTSSAAAPATSREAGQQSPPDARARPPEQASSVPASATPTVVEGARDPSRRSPVVASIIALVLLLGGAAAVWAVVHGDDRACTDQTELAREEVINPVDRTLIASAVMMQSKTCDVWLKVEVDDEAERLMKLVMEYGGRTVSREATDSLVETDMVRVPAGTPLVGEVEVFSVVDPEKSWKVTVRASS